MTTLEISAMSTAEKLQVMEDLWDSLIHEVSYIESLTIYAGIHQKEFGFFRMLSKRFPYCIYYTVQDDIATVAAVLPMRKDPAWVNEAMGERKNS